MWAESVKKYRGDMRDPYMGNTLPVIVYIYSDEDGYIRRVTIVSPEGIETQAKPMDDKDVQPMNDL